MAIEYSSLRYITPGMEILALEYGEYFNEPEIVNMEQTKVIAIYAINYVLINTAEVGSAAEVEALNKRLDYEYEIRKLFPNTDDSIGAVKVALKIGDKMINSIKGREKRTIKSS